MEVRTSSQKDSRPASYHRLVVLSTSLCGNTVGDFQVVSSPKEHQSIQGLPSREALVYSEATKTNPIPFKKYT